MVDPHAGEEQRMITRTVEEITEKFGHEYWRSCVSEGRFVEELWSMLGEKGYLGTIIPESFDGVGMGLPEQATLVEEFAAHGVPLFSFISSATVAPVLIRAHADDELQERILPGLASGDLLLSFAVTEPNVGSNSLTISTNAKRDGDEYVINGKKSYITGARESDYIQLLTRTIPYEDVDDDQRAYGGTLLLVDPESDGITMSPMDVDIPEPTKQYEIFFDEVRVPAANRIGDENKGFYYMLDTLAPERIVTAALSVGLGRFSLDRGRAYASDRTVFDAPIGSHQAVQHPLTRSMIDLKLSSLGTYTAARKYEAGDDEAAIWANIAKYAASEAGDRAMEAAIQTLGGNAFSREYDVITLRNWTRFTRIGPVSNEMVLNHLAENALGLPTSY